MKKSEVGSLQRKTNRTHARIYNSLVINLALLHTELSLIMSVYITKTVGFGDIRGIGLGRESTVSGYVIFAAVDTATLSAATDII